MRCSQGHENPEGSAFCDECGERLDTSSAAQPAVAVASAPSATPDMAAGAGAASASGAKLVIVSDNFVFEVPDKPEVLIGREDPLSDIYPDLDLTEHGGEEGGVSRMHAKLLNNGGQWSLEDENSTNSTFLNRQKLNAKTPTPVKDGDEIRLGKVALRFQSA